MKPFSSREALRSHQQQGLQALVRIVLAGNPFYQAKLEGLPPNWEALTLEALLDVLPFTSKGELAESQRLHPPYGNHLSFPLSRYTRCHQTSGTSGFPLRWLDTPESWAWMLDNWKRVFAAASVTPSDRVYFAFSFGPFLGFWTAFEAATSMGCLCFPSGGLSTSARARAILESGATVLCCTPSYALHLGETIRKEALPLERSQVRRLLVAGEPGGSIPATRSRIESLWPGALVVDHHGMTEIGPVSYQCPAQSSLLHVMEASFLLESIHPENLTPAEPGRPGELVLTNLGRDGSPLIRYRTGDLVSLSDVGLCKCGSLDRGLTGGILGRTDDMVVVRGVNLYPSAVHEVIQNTPGIGEYQVQIHTSSALTTAKILIELDEPCVAPAERVHRLESNLHTAFSLRFELEVRPFGTLPRSEHKSRRWMKG